MAGVVKFPASMEREFQKWRKEQEEKVLAEDSKADTSAIDRYIECINLAKELVDSEMAYNALVKYDDPEEKIPSHSIRIYTDDFYVEDTEMKDGTTSKEKLGKLIASANYFQISCMGETKRISINFHFENLYSQSEEES